MSSFGIDDSSFELAFQLFDTLGAVSASSQHCKNKSQLALDPPLKITTSDSATKPVPIENLPNEDLSIRNFPDNDLTLFDPTSCNTAPHHVSRENTLSQSTTSKSDLLPPRQSSWRVSSSSTLSQSHPTLKSTTSRVPSRILKQGALFKQPSNQDYSKVQPPIKASSTLSNLLKCHESSRTSKSSSKKANLAAEANLSRSSLLSFNKEYQYSHSSSLTEHAQNITSNLSEMPTKNLKDSLKQKMQCTTVFEPEFPIASSSDSPLLHFDANTRHSWHYPSNYEKRDYQYRIVKTALLYNTLVCLPTGLGKTLIAAVVIYNFYRWYPESKILFMAPAKPLVYQQIEACRSIVSIPEETCISMTGAVNVALRKTFWDQKRVFFVTPHIPANDIEAGRCPAEKISLIVVDEAHKAQGGYSYCDVIRQVAKRTRHFRVLALTATPGNDLTSIQQLINNLLISKIEYRTEQSIDVNPYIYDKQIQHIQVPPSTQIMHVRDHYFQLIVDKPIHWLQTNGTLFRVRQGEALSFGRLEAARRLFRLKSNTYNQKQDAFLNWNVEAHFATAMTLYHGLRLLNDYGLRPFKEWVISQSNRPFREKTSTYFNEIIQSVEWNRLYVQVNELNEETITHPKIKVLEKLVLEHVQKARNRASSTPNNDASSTNTIIMGDIKDTLLMTESSDVLLNPELDLEDDFKSDTRIMIFAQYRSTVEEIVHILSAHSPLLRPMAFIGQSKRGLTQKRQAEVIEMFRQGGYNILVSTSIGEEGLDIGEVDLIVCFDAQTSPIRMIQRFGRTGRKRKGKCILLLTEGSMDQGAYQKVQQKKKSMLKWISDDSKLMFYDPAGSGEYASLLPFNKLPKVELLFMKKNALSEELSNYSNVQPRGEITQINTKKFKYLKEPIELKRVEDEIDNDDWEATEDDDYNFNNEKNRSTLESLNKSFIGTCHDEMDIYSCDLHIERSSLPSDITNIDPVLISAKPICNHHSTHHDALKGHSTNETLNTLSLIQPSISLREINYEAGVHEGSDGAITKHPTINLGNPIPEESQLTLPHLNSSITIDLENSIYCLDSVSHHSYTKKDDLSTSFIEIASSSDYFNPPAGPQETILTLNYPDNFFSTPISLSSDVSKDKTIATIPHLTSKIDLPDQVHFENHNQHLDPSSYLPSPHHSTSTIRSDKVSLVSSLLSQAKETKVSSILKPMNEIKLKQDQEAISVKDTPNHHHQSSTLSVETMSPINSSLNVSFSLDTIEESPMQLQRLVRNKHLDQVNEVKDIFDSPTKESIIHFNDDTNSMPVIDPELNHLKWKHTIKQGNSNHPTSHPSWFSNSSSSISDNEKNKMHNRLSQPHFNPLTKKSAHKELLSELIDDEAAVSPDSSFFLANESQSFISPDQQDELNLDIMNSQDMAFIASEGSLASGDNSDINMRAIYLKSLSSQISVLPERFSIPSTKLQNLTKMRWKDGFESQHARWVEEGKGYLESMESSVNMSASTQEDSIVNTSKEVDTNNSIFTYLESCIANGHERKNSSTLFSIEGHVSSHLFDSRRNSNSSTVCRESLLASKGELLEDNYVFDQTETNHSQSLLSSLTDTNSTSLSQGSNTELPCSAANKGLLKLSAREHASRTKRQISKPSKPKPPPLLSRGQLGMNLFNPSLLCSSPPSSSLPSHSTEFSVNPDETAKITPGEVWTDCASSSKPTNSPFKVNTSVAPPLAPPVLIGSSPKHAPRHFKTLKRPPGHVTKVPLTLISKDSPRVSSAKWNANKSPDQTNSSGHLSGTVKAIKKKSRLSSASSSLSTLKDYVQVQKRIKTGQTDPTASKPSPIPDSNLVNQVADDDFFQINLEQLIKDRGGAAPSK